MQLFRHRVSQCFMKERSIIAVVFPSEVEQETFSEWFEGTSVCLLLLNGLADGAKWRRREFGGRETAGELG